MEKKAKNDQPRRRWLWGCLAAFALSSALVVIGGAVFIFMLADSFEDTSQCDVFSLTASGLEDHANVELPTSVSDFEMECSGFFDNHTLDARFALAPSDLDTLRVGIENLDVWEADPILTDEMIAPLSGNVSRRQIEGMDSYVFVEGLRFTALIDTSEPESYQVYWTTFVYF
jgi:hypothetical protein